MSSRGAAASAWRAVLSSSPSRCCLQRRGSLAEALVSPESELRMGRWLATASTIDRPAASTLPRQIKLSPGISLAPSIRGYKADCRSFASEPVSREEKQEKKEKGRDEDGVPSTSTSPSSTSTSSTSTSSTTSWSAAGWSLDSCATLPNAISVSRALAAPFLFRSISHGEWEVAGVLLVFGAASDWADGAAARFLDGRRRRKRSESERNESESNKDGSSSSSSPSSAPSSSSSSHLGTYLDPLADKVFIGAAVAAAAGWGGGDGGGGGAGFFEGGEEAEESEESDGCPQQRQSWPLLPGWLAAAVIGRDVVLVAGALVARLRQFDGGRWPGGPEFFRVVDDANGKKASSSSSSPAAAPRIRPLFVSKLNTALQFATVGAAVADSAGRLDGWVGRAREVLTSSSSTPSPATGEGGTTAAVEAAASALASNFSGSDVVTALAAATAATTALSGWAYASAYLKARKQKF